MPAPPSARGSRGHRRPRRRRRSRLAPCAAALHANATLPFAWLQHRFDAIGPRAVDDAFDEREVHGAHEISLFARQCMKWTVRESDRVLLDAGLVTVDGKDVSDLLDPSASVRRVVPR